MTMMVKWASSSTSAPTHDLAGPSGIKGFPFTFRFNQYHEFQLTSIFLKSLYSLKSIIDDDMRKNLLVYSRR